MPTLISHFFNEEFLLPFWLKHHRRLFSHGVLINYDSTDRSLEIIRELCPTWEIRKSRNRAFDARGLDDEIMEVENGISGWKMCLNTTEFLFVRNLQEYLSDKSHLNGVQTRGVIMVDPPGQLDPVHYRIDLFRQRHHGYVETDVGYTFENYQWRRRLIHQCKNGNYGIIGRHRTLLPNVIQDNNFLLLWFGWSPYPQLKNRKMQIQFRCTKNDLDRHIGTHHVKTPEGMDRQLEDQQRMITDLFDNPIYMKSYREILGGMII